jgi:hypothetical protein
MRNDLNLLYGGCATNDVYNIDININLCYKFKSSTAAGAKMPTYLKLQSKRAFSKPVYVMVDPDGLSSVSNAKAGKTRVIRISAHDRVLHLAADDDMAGAIGSLHNILNEKNNKLTVWDILIKRGALQNDALDGEGNIFPAFARYEEGRLACVHFMRGGRTQVFGTNFPGLLFLNDGKAQRGVVVDNDTERESSDWELAALSQIFSRVRVDGPDLPPKPFALGHHGDELLVIQPV